jgi:hypothetical protein
MSSATSTIKYARRPISLAPFSSIATLIEPPSGSGYIRVMPIFCLGENL